MTVGGRLALDLAGTLGLHVQERVGIGNRAWGLGRHRSASWSDEQGPVFARPAAADTCERRRDRPREGSDLLVGRDVPAADDFAAERTVGLLFLVLELDLPVVERDLVHRNDVRAGRAA